MKTDYFVQAMCNDVFLNKAMPAVTETFTISSSQLLLI